MSIYINEINRMQTVNETFKIVKYCEIDHIVTTVSSYEVAYTQGSQTLQINTSTFFVWPLSYHCTKHLKLVLNGKTSNKPKAGKLLKWKSPMLEIYNSQNKLKSQTYSESVQIVFKDKTVANVPIKIKYSESVVS